MFYVIHDFMIEDLELKGTDLNVFALIYSFKEYKGSLDFTSRYVGAKSLTTIQSSLKRLLNLGFIIKNKPEGKFSVCTYTVNYKHPNIPLNQEKGKSKFRKHKGEWSGSHKDETVVGLDFKEC